MSRLDPKETKMRFRSVLVHLHLLLLPIALLVTTETVARARPEAVAPPVAKTVPHSLEKHGLVRQDDYYWLNQRDNPEVLRYLEAENAYTSSMMAHTERLQAKLVREFKKRIKQTDVSVPYRMDDYEYYSKVVEGKEYPIHYRRPVGGGPEQVMLDVNAMAEGHGYFAASGLRVSSGQDLLAYAADTVGRRIYTIHVKNLATGETLSDSIPDVTANLAWANDNKTLFYTKQDPQTLRSYQVWRHVVGTDAAADQLVYEESDPTFDVRVGKTRSKRYLMIFSTQTLTTEQRYLDAARPDGRFELILPRQRGHEYQADHWGDHFYIRTNSQDAKNFRLVRAPIGATSMDRWEEVIAHRDDVLLEDFELFRDHLVVVERNQGLLQLRVRPWSGAGEHYLDFGEPAYAADLKDNAESNTNILRYVYNSMTTPPSVYDYDMERRQKVLLKRDEVGGGFDPADYQTDRLQAVARDGTRVPISIVYRKGTPRDGSHPLLLYAYGSYGASMDASFSAYRISLLDRGFVYALAHVRGGQELGRQWYEDGKLLKKKNTFTDFIDCAEYLVREGYTRPERLYIQGGSAGGLLIGAVINMRPDLFHAAVAHVPFVDVVTTMLDDSIPLTTGEYDEWGNPNDKEYFDYMLSYSPYDNVAARDYPALLVTTGLHDSQVQYFEPAKWVARLRARRTDDDPLLMKTEMEAGHGGRSGRTKRYEEVAFSYAFLLDQAGVKK
jgi:oligopeptidase B